MFFSIKTVISTKQIYVCTHNHMVHTHTGLHFLCEDPLPACTKPQYYCVKTMKTPNYTNCVCVMKPVCSFCYSRVEFLSRWIPFAKFKARTRSLSARHSELWVNPVLEKLRQEHHKLKASMGSKSGFQVSQFYCIVKPCLHFFSNIWKLLNFRFLKHSE